MSADQVVHFTGALRVSWRWPGAAPRVRRTRSGSGSWLGDGPSGPVAAKDGIHVAALGIVTAPDLLCASNVCGAFSDSTWERTCDYRL